MVMYEVTKVSVLVAALERQLVWQQPSYNKNATLSSVSLVVALLRSSSSQLSLSTSPPYRTLSRVTASSVSSSTPPLRSCPPHCQHHVAHRSRLRRWSPTHLHCLALLPRRPCFLAACAVSILLFVVRGCKSTSGQWPMGRCFKLFPDLFLFSRNQLSDEKHSVPTLKPFFLRSVFVLRYLIWRQLICVPHKRFSHKVTSTNLYRVVFGRCGYRLTHGCPV